MKLSIITAWLFLLLVGCRAGDNQSNTMEAEGISALNNISMPHATEMQSMPHVAASDPIQAGRYLVIVGGCNDCHTDGFMMTEGNVPEENWLTGSPVGWQGPWGTTFPPNLRLRVQEWSEDAWVQTLKTRKALPPMPWMNLNQMNEQDMRAIYAYIQSLGPKGEHMPLAVAPDSIPGTPYLSLFPQNLSAQ